MNPPPPDVFSDDFDVEGRNQAPSFAIDDDDECEIEDAEESDDDSVDHRQRMSKMFRDSDDNIHDQLPSVEEVKASNAYLPTARLVAKSHRRKMYLIIAGAALAAMVLSVSITVGVFKRANKKNHIDYVMETPRYDEVVDYIFESGVSDLPSLRLSGTPESYAAAFMANGDSYSLAITNIDAAARRKFMERYVLVLIYYKSQGQNWNDNYHFLSPIDHCKWHLQYTTPQGRFLRGVQCNKEGFVVDLDLSNNNLVMPEIPYEIDYFENLERLHLYGNSIGGTLSMRLTKLKKIKSLGLMDLQLRGTIPSFLGEMTSLTTLALSNTRLGATVPSSFHKLTNLRVLGMDGMGLTGSIDPITNLPKLEALYLEDNMLTGWSYTVDWPSMKELDLSNNIFHQALDENLFNIENLNVLDINNNLFYGIFPERLVENDSLQYISMHKNRVEGELSERIGFLKNLKHLDVADNELVGTLPDTIQLLTHLVSLSTSGNHFSRQRLREDFFRPLTKLKDLSMKNNSLTGDIPDEAFSLMTNLRMLDLARNELVGPIPKGLGTMKDLAILQLNRNMLSGTIPSELTNNKRLQILLLDNNHLHGRTEELCAAQGAPKFKHFTTDCYPALNSEVGAEVECRCCTLCCNDDTPDCNDHDWSSSYDPKSEYGYIRPNYEFVLDQVEEDWKMKAWQMAQAPTEAPRPTMPPNPFDN